jgi:hypothetical protein
VSRSKLHCFAHDRRYNRRTELLDYSN